jgi:hypothetical protein
MNKSDLANLNDDELNRLATDYTDYAIQLAASQLLTERMASKINRPADYVLNQVKLANGRSVTLGHHDYETYQHWLNRGQVMVRACKKHKPDRCQCWQPVRDFVYSVQDRCPNSPLAQVAEQLWTVIEAFAYGYEPPPRTGPVLSRAATVADINRAAEPQAPAPAMPSWMARLRKMQE